MGGMISITLAMKHPALVERMVLLGPTITGRLSNFINTIIAPVFLIERFLLGNLLIPGVEKAVVGITDRMMRPVSFAERYGITLEDYKRLMADARRRGQGRVRAECFFAMRENNLSGLLAQVETPSLVVWGAEDNTVPLRDAGVVADEWPAADLRIVPKAGHWPHFEAPDITRRLVASFLGLPLLSDKLTPVGDDELDRISELADFLTNSDIGANLRCTQLTRLAAQFRQMEVPPHSNIVNVDEPGNEMYLVHSGTVEVWSDPENPGPKPLRPRKMAVVQPGQMTGDLAMIDQGTWTADLITGEEGATILALERERLLALMEDDPELGTRLLWNIATAMSHRVRFILWQLNRAEQRTKEAEKRYKQREKILI
jgi:CRP-like cAMP-binding protein